MATSSFNHVVKVTEKEAPKLAKILSSTKKVVNLTKVEPKEIDFAKLKKTYGCSR